MTDIVKRLRAESRIIFDDDDFDAIDAQREEAAHEIERLRAALMTIKRVNEKQEFPSTYFEDVIEAALEGK
jgi:hypothetical protein